MRFNILICLLLLAPSLLFSEDERGSLGKITAEIESYKDTTVTLNLRLRNVDRIFEKIVFYDSDNIDIEFDISGKVRKKALAPYFRNIREGMLYSVKFRVIGAGVMGGLLGEIESFTPVIIESIPLKTGGS